MTIQFNTVSPNCTSIHVHVLISDQTMFIFSIVYFYSLLLFLVSCSVQYCYLSGYSRVADPDGVDPNPDQTFEKIPDLILEKKTASGSGPKKTRRTFFDENGY